MKNEVNKNSFYGFVDDALERKKDRQHAAPVGFLDTKIMRVLEGKGITLGDHYIIMLESKLVNGKKYTGRHMRIGNAPLKEDWYNLLGVCCASRIKWYKYS